MKPLFTPLSDSPEALDASLPVVTLWGPDLGELTPPGDPEETRRRHLLFAQLAVSVAQQAFPQLLDAVRATGGRMLVMPHRFFVVPAGAAQGIELPGLSNALRMLPWANAGETAH